MKNIRGLSIQQPYASLLSSGRKHYETRSYPTSYRGPILIHAGKKEWKGWRQDPRLVSLSEGLEKPSGAFLATGNLVACHPITEAFMASLSDDEKAMGFYSPGRFAWEIEDVQPLTSPVRARGYLGLWHVDNV